MARVARIALDLTLVSLSKIRPVVSKVWHSAKTAITKTPAKKLVCNPIVNKAEVAVDKLTDMVVNLLTKLQASKTLKPAIGTAWQYAKIELVPPMTIDFFHGPVGKKIEDTVANASETFIASIQDRIRQIELEEARLIKQKEAEAKAAQAKLKAEAQRKAEDAKKKEDEKLAKEAKARQEAEADKKAKADKKASAEAAKAPKAAPATKKDTPKTTEKRKMPKKNRREEKKGSPPKPK